MPKLIKKIFSKQNNEVQLFIAESFCRENPKIVIIIGVFHGDEPEGEYLINKLMNEDLNTKNTVLYIPCLNPDGKSANTRTNSNGVDLNRNFPTKNWKLSPEKDNYYSGDVPASEIETRFLIEIIEEYKPNRILTLHTPYRIVNYDGMSKKAKEIAEEISRLNGYPVEESIGYPTPGSFGTYAGIERNIPTITLELPENEDLEKLWKDNKEAFYYFLNS